MAGFVGRIQEYRLGSGRQRRAEIGLIVGIAHQDGGALDAGLAADGGERGIEEAFARSIAGQDLVGRDLLRPSRRKRRPIQAAMEPRNSSEPRMGGYLANSASASRILSATNAGMVSRGSPSVRSMVFGVARRDAVEQMAQPRERRQDCAVRERGKTGEGGHR